LRKSGRNYRCQNCFRYPKQSASEDLFLDEMNNYRLKTLHDLNRDFERRHKRMTHVSGILVCDH